MTKVLLERLQWIETAFRNGQLTKKETEFELKWIDCLLDAEEFGL